MTTPPDMKVRISSDLRKKIEASAKANNRTMNGEIVARLEASFGDDAGLAGRVAALEAWRAAVEEHFVVPVEEEPLSALTAKWLKKAKTSD